MIGCSLLRRYLGRETAIKIIIRPFWLNNDPRQKFIDSINLEGTKVKSLPGFIFSCGGMLRPANCPPTSARDAFHRGLSIRRPELAEKIINAEDIQAWLHDATYDDLITFECHLAHLASLIILFPESPGSYTELGAFAMTSSIVEKLHVFIRQDLFDQQSFISLGPIRYIDKNYGNKRIHAYPWRINNISPIFPDVGQIDANSVNQIVPDIISDIEQALSDTQEQKAITKDDICAKMLFICEMAYLFIAIKEREILHFLSRAGFETNSDEVRRLIFILLNTELLQKTRYGNDTYFYTKAKPNFLSYAFKNKDRIDHTKTRVIVSAHYDDIDKKRKRAIKSAEIPEEIESVAN